jgi:putative DNA methylase
LGNWVLEKVRAEIGDLYPLIPDPECSESRLQAVQAAELKDRSASSSAQPAKAGTPNDPFAEPQHVMGFADDPQQRLKARTGFLTPVAYLWTRTVQCKNPTCGATVPLVKQTWLCKKEGRYVALKVIAETGNGRKEAQKTQKETDSFAPSAPLGGNQKRVRFEVVEASTAAGLGFDAEAFSKRGNATCPFCGTVADSGYVKQEGCAGRIANQIMAVACTSEGRQGKVYLPAENVPRFTLDEDAIKKRIDDLSKRTGLTVPSEPIVDDAKNSFWARLYGTTN